MSGGEVRRVALGALRRRRRPLVRLAAWSVAEALPTLVAGYATAHALDDGFLAGRLPVGLAWLGLVAAATGVGAVGSGRAYGCLGDIVEPFRDELVQRVVTGALRRSTAPGARPDTAAVTRLTHQVEIVRDTFAGLVMVVRGFLFVAGAALLGLLSLAPIVAALVAVPLVAALAVFVAALPAMVARQREYVRAGERLGEAAGAALAGQRDVLACGAQDRVAAGVGERVEAQAAAERALARMAAVRGLILALGGWIPLAVLLLAAPWLVRRGLTAGAVLGALVYVSTGLQPALHALVQGIAGGGLRFAVTLGRILAASADPAPADPLTAPVPADPVTADPVTANPVTANPVTAPVTANPASAPVPGRHATPPAPRDPATEPVLGGPGPARHRPAGVRPPAVRLRGVSFRYGPRARPVLDDVDLVLPEGERLAVVGPSGAGKSTLAALVAGLLPPLRGTIHLSGSPVAGAEPEALAGRRVLIPQEAYVFGGTLAENLRYLCPDAPDRRLTEAAEALGLGPVLSRLGGLSATLDPATLSAGERQLVAAVRAYLSPAPLVLLDEATCHLDPAAEAEVERVFADRPGTLVVIAHRISSALRARRVLLLDGGPPMLDGHDALLTRSPSYRELVGHWTRSDAAPEPTGPDTAPGRVEIGVASDPTGVGVAPGQTGIGVASGPTGEGVGSDPAGLAGDADGLDPGTGPGLGRDAGEVVADRSGR